MDHSVFECLLYLKPVIIKYVVNCAMQWEIKQTSLIIIIVKPFHTFILCWI
jgi:hypothetical protein